MRAANWQRFAAAFILLLATFARAQDSQFLFDLNGNLFIQTAEVTTPPQILGQPQNQIVESGQAASFFVVAAKTRALSYQWRFNDADIGGATNDALLLQNVSTNNEGEYRVVLTNPSGSVTSAPALLMIDSDADGVPDSWERTYFTNLNQNATADFDGDGVSNFQEFHDSTNPTNSASALFRLTVVRDGGSVVAVPDQSAYTNGQTVTLTATASSNETFRAWLGDVVTRSNSVTLVMTTNKTVHARFTPMVFTWANFAGGNWNGAANWSPTLVPGSNDSVVISGYVLAGSGGFTVTLDTPADCAFVTLDGFSTRIPTLTGSGTLTVREGLLWRGGTMSGSGRTVLETGATLTLDTADGLTLNTRTLELGGDTFWRTAGTLSLNNAVITNRAGAVFHAWGPGAFSRSGGTARFDNTGAFQKAEESGTTALGNAALGSGVAFNNSGTVTIETGTLNLAGGGTNSGSFDMAPGTALTLSGGTFNAGASSSITGGAQLTVSGGTANLAGLVNLSGNHTFSGGTANLIGDYICTNNTLTISGGTANVTGNYICVNDLLTVSGGAANFNGTGFVSASVVNLSAGTLGGSNVVTVGTQMNWSGGTMSGSGRTIIQPAAALNKTNANTVTLASRTLDNGGTVLWAGSGVFVVTSGAVITNRPGALFRAEGESNNGLGGGAANARFDNAGTFRKSAGTGTTTVASGLKFTNYNTVDIRSGILAANGGYVSSPSALLNCAVGGTAPGTGHGQLRVAGAVTLNGALSVDLINGFVPATNDSFTVLTAGTRNGTFANFFYPSNTVAMQLSNTANSVITRVSGLVAPELVLFPPVLTGSNVMLCWIAESNKTYRLEYALDLGLTNWNVASGDVIISSNKACATDALTSSNRFYRVRVLP